MKFPSMFHSMKEEGRGPTLDGRFRSWGTIRIKWWAWPYFFAVGVWKILTGKD